MQSMSPPRNDGPTHFKRKPTGNKRKMMNPGQPMPRRKPEGKKEKKQYNKMIKQRKRAQMEAQLSALSGKSAEAGISKRELRQRRLQLFKEEKEKYQSILRSLRLSGVQLAVFLVVQIISHSDSRTYQISSSVLVVLSLVLVYFLVVRNVLAMNRNVSRTALDSELCKTFSLRWFLTALTCNLGYFLVSNVNADRIKAKLGEGSNATLAKELEGEFVQAITMQAILTLLASVLSAVFLVSFPVRSSDLKINESFSISFTVVLYQIIELLLFIAYCATWYFA